MSGIAPIQPLSGQREARALCPARFLRLLFLVLSAVELLSAETGLPAAGAPGERTPPEAPQVRSPVDFFRELLALSPVQQRAALANRPVENQLQILAKIKEYESLSPNERALRLRSTELRWYLLPLMQTPPTNRPAQLQRVPEDLRPLIQDRITAWDEMPEALRRELLESEPAIRHITDTTGSRPASLSSDAAAELVHATQRWQNMPDEQRLELLHRFERFFGLAPREQQATLESISAAERRQIEATLKSFSRLSPAQRAESIRALQRFTSLPPEERRQFLENAERWKRMTPDQRKAWRDLVARLSLQPPPLPGTGPNPPPVPTTSRPLVTNGN